jgi:hypothetical protein
MTKTVTVILIVVVSLAIGALTWESNHYAGAAAYIKPTVATLMSVLSLLFAWTRDPPKTRADAALAVAGAVIAAQQTDGAEAKEILASEADTLPELPKVKP